METKLLVELNNILESFPEYWDGDILLRSKVSEDLKNYNEELLSKILESETLRANYTKNIGDSLIILVDELSDIIKYKEYWADSYTKFSNKIGLTSGGRFIDNNTDVVLDFPFKDCVLEGGMSREDVGKNEVFYNNVIARDEIDELFSPKVFTNVKKYTSEGIEKISSFEDSDNLIIKGNNLIALHSLKEKYAGKIKLIYIDPPYNTGNDSFMYNDKFNHSSWLTFMKNRLEIARELLTKDGLIFISIDRNQFAELKLLMDECFFNNYMGTIVNVSTPNGRDYGAFAQTHDYIHVYAKNVFEVKSYALDGDESKFKNSDEISKFYLHPLFNSNSAFHIKNRPNLYYPFYLSKNPSKSGEYRLSLVKSDDFNIEVYPPKSQKDGTQFVWRWGKEKSIKLMKTELIGQKKGDGTYRIAQKMRPQKQIPRTVWQETKFSNRRGTEELEKLFDSKIFSYPKPESLLREIIEISTENDDIVLDYHMGSGTTQAVAMKTGRRFIGIEQMDYIEDVSVERLKKVIDGEQGGISKEVNWQGGSSFVYAELMKHNQIYIEMINEATTKEILSEIYSEMQNSADLNFRVDLNVVDLAELDFNDAKRYLLEVLDKNNLYVPYSEIDDESFEIDDATKLFNRSFYGNGDSK